jgi:SPP1 family predicted phage head-tail adaptor
MSVEMQVSGGTGDRGQPLYTWTEPAKVWVKIEALTGRKLEIARQVVPTATHEIAMRFLDGLAVTDRIRDLDTHKIYQIGLIQIPFLFRYAHLLTVTEGADL